MLPCCYLPPNFFNRLLFLRCYEKAWLVLNLFRNGECYLRRIYVRWLIGLSQSVLPDYQKIAVCLITTCTEIPKGFVYNCGGVFHWGVYCEWMGSCWEHPGLAVPILFIRLVCAPCLHKGRCTFPLTVQDPAFPWNCICRQVVHNL